MLLLTTFFRRLMNTWSRLVSCLGLWLILCSFVTRHLCDWLAGVQQLHPKSQRRSPACLFPLEWRLPTACWGYVQGCCRGTVRHPLLRSQWCLLLLCEHCILVFYCLRLTQPSAFLMLLVGLLKSWRKDCTEMEKYIIIVFFLWYSEWGGSL